MNASALPVSQSGRAIAEVALTPFRKILVANRGEVAVRVIRTARRLGYRTVAVFSQADARSPHVEAADQAVCIGGALPMHSYLDIERILSAARASGADAVHPGYGFLSESDAFAQACREAGLVFIGPAPEAIAAMGNKGAAKRRMIEVDVPCVPGYHGADQSDLRLAAEAERIGYPVMIKAAAGGGGRGMRLASSPAELPGLARSARAEALSAFGNPELLLEKAIAEPRHIEIQIVADRHGNVVHLGERDCSVQRRHQKVIEEAPSPAVGPELRERIASAAIRAAKAVDYEGVGTIEFLLDASGCFYFMEANTRLQVEHPVTEALTGLDLVELQLLVACGAPLPFVQSDVRFDGCAIEARLCAEDAQQAFLPQGGTMVLWSAPEHLRVEHALRSGLEIPTHYDSMLAKLVAHGRSREDARRKLLSGLEETIALGVTTNQQFLANCLSHPEFVAGNATTAFIARHAEALLQLDDEAQQRASALAALLLFETNGESGEPLPAQPFTNALSVPLLLEMNAQRRPVTVRRQPGQRYRIDAGEVGYAFEVIALDSSFVRFECDGIVERAAYWRDGPRLMMHYRGAAFDVEDLTRAPVVRAGGASVAGDGTVRALTSGRVVAVLVALGESVRAGQAIVVLEAMKMEHTHVAPIAGTIRNLNVCVGGQVAARGVVAEIHPEPPVGETTPA